jgi:uncharacterized protein (DUF302 family)
MNSYRKLLIPFVFFGLFQGSVTRVAASDTPDPPFNLQDAATVAEAVAQITAALEDQDLDIVGVIDHAAAAAGVGLVLRPTTVILFTDPDLDTQLIRRSQTIGIDLPQKILVWEDAAGEIRLSYNPPGYLADRHGIVPRDSLLRRVGERLGQFGTLEDGLMSIESLQSVEATIATLRNLLTQARFGLLPTIDHQAIAEEADRRLRPAQLLIFGNPAVGTQLMQNQQAIGIDLPLKYLVWEDRQGRVFISYNDPRFIGARHNIQGLGNVLGNIANALANFANQAAQPAP